MPHTTAEAKEDDSPQPLNENLGGLTLDQQSEGKIADRALGSSRHPNPQPCSGLQPPSGLLRTQHLRSHAPPEPTPGDQVGRTTPSPRSARDPPCGAALPEVVATALRPSTLLMRAGSPISIGVCLAANHPDVVRLEQPERAHINRLLICDRRRPWRGWLARDKPVAASMSKRAVAALDHPFTRHGLTILRGTAMRPDELLDLELNSCGSRPPTAAGSKLRSARAAPNAQPLSTPPPWPRAAPGWPIAHARDDHPAEFLFMDRGRQRTLHQEWWARVDSNHLPPRYQHGALPVELLALHQPRSGHVWNLRPQSLKEQVGFLSGRSLRYYMLCWPGLGLSSGLAFSKVRDLAEVMDSNQPGERLTVCTNPPLAQERDLVAIGERLGIGYLRSSYRIRSPPRPPPTASTCSPLR